MTQLTLPTPLMPMIAAADPLDHVVDHFIFRVGDFWLLSNHVIMLLTSAVIMLLIFPRLSRHYRDGKLVPTGTRNFFEAIILFVRNDIAKPALGDETDRFMPFLWTLFFFVWITNLLGLLPLDAIQKLTFGQVIGEGFHPIYGTATSNFYVTGTLALITFAVVQFNGIKANGIGAWLRHFLGGAPAWLAPIMVPVEFLGMVIKPFSLAIRLAANMTAGHILLAVLIGFVPTAFTVSTGAGIGIGIVSVTAAVAIMVLELFIATLQAYLFTFLSALFISQLISHHNHGDDTHHEEDGHEFSVSHAVRDHQAMTHPVKGQAAH